VKFSVLHISDLHRDLTNELGNPPDPAPFMAILMRQSIMSRRMMRFVEPFPEELPPAHPARRHELLIEILRFLTPVLALISSIVALSGKYPSLSKPWVLDIIVALGVLILMWFARPRLAGWLHKVRANRRDQRFIVENGIRLRELLDQFAAFTSNNNTRSLIYILRSAYSQNMVAVEHIIAGDYIGSWLYCYREQLAFPTKSLYQFLSQCREFSHILQEFNTNYMVRAQRQLAAATPLAEDSIAQLEEFREEYTAFLRAVEPWAKGIANYLQSGGVTDHPTLWRLAPTNHFERAKSFRRTKPTKE